MTIYPSPGDLDKTSKEVNSDPPIDQTARTEGVDMGLPAIDHTGIADTATLMMALSKEAIASDVYNLKRNATSTADTYRRAGNMALLKGLGDITAGVINFGTDIRNQYQENNPGNVDVSAGEMMNWYFNNDLW